MTPVDPPYQSSSIVADVAKGFKSSENPFQSKICTFRTKPATNSSALDYHIIGKTFYPIIWLTKLCGFCPLKVTRNCGKDTDEKFLYSFNWISHQLLRSLLVALFGGFMLTQWILSSMFKIDGPLKIFSKVSVDNAWVEQAFYQSSSVLRIFKDLIKIWLPIGAWFLLFFQILNISIFCKFLNNWPEFLERLVKTFPLTYGCSNGPCQGRKFSRLPSTRNKHFIVWVTPVILYLAVLQPPNHMAPYIPAWIGIALAYYQIFYVMGTRAFSYIRDLLSLEAILTAYDQILEGIRFEYGTRSNAIRRKDVSAWIDLIKYGRKQVALLQGYIGLPNLWSIFEVFVTLILILSLSALLFIDKKIQVGRDFVALVSVCATFLIFSLFWKAVLADRIREKEEKIAETIVKMETDDDDLETRLEMKLGIDLLLDDPVNIEFASTIVLNKKLLLGFFGQLTTYLILVLQYADK